MLGPILEAKSSVKLGIVKLIAPGDAESIIYRARHANNPHERLSIYKRPIQNLSAPPPALNSGGRMNAAGISVFYGSFDRLTCLAETRIPVGGEAIIGRFELLRPIKVLDLTRLEYFLVEVSYFAPNFEEMFAYEDFIRQFHTQLRKPVIPGREHLDYLPTQFVAEYLWNQTICPLDGVVFGSSQITNGAKNIVLFPRAINVLGYDGEQDRAIELVTNDQSEHETVWTADNRYEDAAVTSGQGRATLKLCLDDLVIARVEEIRLEAQLRSIEFAAIR